MLLIGLQPRQASCLKPHIFNPQRRLSGGASRSTGVATPGKAHGRLGRPLGPHCNDEGVRVLAQWRVCLTACCRASFVDGLLGLECFFCYLSVCPSVYASVSLTVNLYSVCFYRLLSAVVCQGWKGLAWFGLYVFAALLLFVLACVDIPGEPLS